MNTKEQIRLTAQNLFREKGYVATSMRDLAGSLDIKAASLYYHVRSKEEILEQICFKIANEFFKKISWIEDCDLVPEEKLRKAILGHVVVITQNIDASAVFMHEWRHLNEPNLSTFIKLRNNYERIYVEIL